MIYPYRCPCGNEFEVIKHSKNIDDVEKCPDCKHNCTKENRYISRGSFYGAADWDNAEYNPALGCVTKNAKHRAQIAKSKGLEEVGNADLNKYHKELDAANQQRRDDRWDKV